MQCLSRCRGYAACRKALRKLVVLGLVIIVLALYSHVVQNGTRATPSDVRMSFGTGIPLSILGTADLFLLNNKSHVSTSRENLVNSKNRTIFRLPNKSKHSKHQTSKKSQKYDKTKNSSGDTVIRLPTRKSDDQTICRPKGLVGRMLVVTTSINISRFSFKEHEDVSPGGHWRPSKCTPRFRVAIIIPYRERRLHLYTLLHYLLPLLKRQQVEFRIFVVEQEGHRTFNKGIIMNAGFKEALKISDYHCYIFHDVDLIPEDDRNLYSCPGYPRHLSVAVDKFRYRLPYKFLVGGVFAIRREDFETLNGYSNLYWGWGAEDDDMSSRLAITGMKLVRPPATVARYKMVRHGGREGAPRKWIYYLLKTVRKRFMKDGLSTVNYNVTFIHMEPLYTHIMVDVGLPPSRDLNITSIIN